MSGLKVELLVHGYIRRQKLQPVPMEIIELVYKWYHNPLYIQYFAEKDGKTMNEEKTMIELGHYTYTSCYGSLVMPSTDNNNVYQYTIKISKGRCVALGLVDALFHKTHCHFYDPDENPSKWYVIFNWRAEKKSHKDGGKWKDLEQYGIVFNKYNPSTVELIYDAYNATLSFVINGKKYGVAFKTHKEHGLHYRIAIYNGADSAQIELMGVSTKCAV